MSPDSSARLAACLERRRPDMVAHLERLVAIQTENPPGTRYLECVAALVDVMASLGLHAAVVPIDSPGLPRAAVCATLGETGPALYLHGHYDVVPAQSPDQFAPRVEGDTVFGRGTSDMKSGLVAMMHAAAALRDLGVPLNGRLGLVFVPDEETGGHFGSAALAAQGLLGRDAVGMLLGEPTSGRVWHANHGAISGEITVRGRSAHVALQHMGVNAFERALPLVGAFLELKRDVERRPGSVLLVGGRVEAGTNFNVVPDFCRFSFDRRITPDESLDTERQRMLDLVERAKRDGAEVEIRIHQEGRSSYSSPGAPVALALAESIADLSGSPATFEACGGLLELRFYAEQGIPSYAYGPGLLAVSHGPREFVRISAMVEAAKVYALTAARLLR